MHCFWTTALIEALTHEIAADRARRKDGEPEPARTVGFRNPAGADFRGENRGWGRARYQWAPALGERFDDGTDARFPKKCSCSGKPVKMFRGHCRTRAHVRAVLERSVGRRSFPDWIERRLAMPLSRSEGEALQVRVPADVATWIEAAKAVIGETPLEVVESTPIPQLVDAIKAVLRAGPLGSDEDAGD